jgi:hypothetical protein
LAADLEFHQLAGAHPADAGDDSDGGGAHGTDQAEGMLTVEWKRPGQMVLPVGTVH